MNGISYAPTQCSSSLYASRPLTPIHHIDAWTL